MSFVINALSNVLANVVFWLALGSLFWAASKATQRKFVRFFGINESRHTVIWLSNLWQPGSGRKPIGFTISKHELLAAQSIASLFSAAPLRLPELVRGLVDSLWLRNSMRCRIEVSPPDFIPLTGKANIVVIGSALRNSLRRHFLMQGSVRAVLSHETSSDTFRSNDPCDIIVRRPNGEEIQRITSGLSVGIIEKVNMGAEAASVVFCGGQRADHSWGAAEFLARNWKSLEREFGSSSFVIGLGFPKRESYLEEYIEPEILISITV